MDLPYLLEVSICLALFYVFYRLLLARDTFFQRNRFYLILAAILSFVVPLAELWLPKSAQESTFRQVLQTVTLSPTPLAGHLSPEKVLSFWQIAGFIYILGLIALSIRFILNIRQIARFIKRNPVESKRGYYLINTEGKLPTFSFFNYLFWDNTQALSEADKERILAHELKHIWDRHSYDNLLLELVKMLLWFNPFAYALANSLQLQHEFIADAAALRESNQKEYRQLLVRNLFERLNLHLVQSFNQKEVRRRLDVMAQSPSKSSQQFKTLLLLPLLLILSMAFVAYKPPAPQQKVNSTEKEVQNRFAEPEAGLDKFYEALHQSIKFPKDAPQLQGRVIVQFTVNKDGSLSDYKVAKSLQPAYDEAVIKAIKNISLKWRPAKVEGKIVRQQVSVPMMFRAQ